MRTRLGCPLTLAVAVGLLSVQTELRAQSGSFVVTLGSDTVQVERFERRADRLFGIVVTRAPATRVVRYAVTFAADGLARQYEVATERGDGTPIRSNGAAGSMTLLPDSITRETLKDGSLTTQRIAAPAGVVPGPSLPFLGTAYLLYELAYTQARRLSAGRSETEWHLLTMHPLQTQPARTKVWLIGADSAESDYFGVARAGFKFDEKGRLLRSDWSQTTYKYQIRRGADVDVNAIAQAWDAKDRAGAAMGAISPLDTVRATIGSASLTLSYSRPAKRGRVIWGGLVPWEQVWRFGADFATHFTTTADLTIGAMPIPAGRYTLWMLPSERSESMLIVNGQTNIFGTQYNVARDVARIPLRRAALSAIVERFTVAIENGRLSMRWDDSEWTVRIVAR